jgi:hypothetical protein
MVKLANEASNPSSPPTGERSFQNNAFAMHLLWAAMEKVGKKELKSNLLPEGTSHTVSLQIDGLVNEEPFSQTIESLVTVGYPQSKTSSINPQVAELIAWILSKLNSATRSHILRDLPEEFETGGGMPESSPSLVDEVNHMLRQLREFKTVNARGPIRCEYVLIGDMEQTER